MDIKFFRQIGKKIFKEISKRKPYLNLTPLGRGASGDITFQVDRVAEDIIIQSIKSAGLNCNIITEEGGSTLVQGKNSTIIIDPIDGSKNAISGIPFFSTSIALADGDCLDSLQMGYIINLVNADEFWAIKGKGAYMNGAKIKTRTEQKPIVIAFESSNPDIDLLKIFPLFKFAHRVRCFGSTALDLAYFSSGAMSIFIIPSFSRIFDFSAGVLIAKEAGAVLSDINGNFIEGLPVEFKTKTTLVACADTEIQKKVLKLLQK